MIQNENDLLSTIEARSKIVSNYSKIVVWLLINIIMKQNYQASMLENGLEVNQKSRDLLSFL